MKVSIALCTYNGEKYLQEQLKSYLTQTVQVDEIIICDDNSNDSTWEILKDFKEKSSLNVRLVRNENPLGVFLNFQQALSLCTGEIILLSDQDDIWKPNRVSFFVDYFIRHKGTELLFSNAELVISGTNTIKAKTLFELLDFGPKTQEAFLNGFGLEVSNILGRISGFTMGIRSRFLKVALPFVHKYDYFIHDRQLALLAIEKEVISFTNECLTYYRLHDNQTSNIYDYLVNNNLLETNDKLLIFAPINADVIDFLNIKGVYSPKFDFSNWRRTNIKSTFGLFSVFSNYYLYKKYYKKYRFQAIKYDFKAYFILNAKRLKSLFK